MHAHALLWVLQCQAKRKNEGYLPAGMLREVVDLQFGLKVGLVGLRLVAARLCPHAGHLGLRECLRDWRNCHAPLQAMGRVSTRCAMYTYATSAGRLSFSCVASSKMHLPATCSQATKHSIHLKVKHIMHAMMCIGSCDNVAIQHRMEWGGLIGSRW